MKCTFLKSRRQEYWGSAKRRIVAPPPEGRQREGNREYKKNGRKWVKTMERKMGRRK